MNLDRNKVRHSADYTTCLCSFARPPQKRYYNIKLFFVQLEKKVLLVRDLPFAKNAPLTKHSICQPKLYTVISFKSWSTKLHQWLLTHCSPLFSNWLLFYLFFYLLDSRQAGTVEVTQFLSVCPVCVSVHL